MFLLADFEGLGGGALFGQLYVWFMFELFFVSLEGEAGGWEKNTVGLVMVLPGWEILPKKTSLHIINLRPTAIINA